MHRYIQSQWVGICELFNFLTIGILCLLVLLDFLILLRLWLQL